ncbi:hypothetical protein LTR08_001504 [Meristemomyces frigidus]|nr:hypothetical protein LTR08_001504 [Meristemomyces frigidus]
MADRPPSRAERLVEESSAEDDDGLALGPIRSTARERNIASDHRSAFGTPSIDRTSRPTSRATSSRSKGKGASYQRPTSQRSHRSYSEPRDYQNLDEVAADAPIRQRRPSGLEDARERGVSSSKTGSETKDPVHERASSQRATPLRRHPSYSEPQDYENLDEVAADAPVGQQRHSGLEDARERRISSSKRGSETKELARRRASRQEEAQALSEEAVKPPVARSSEPSDSSSADAPQKRRRRPDPEDGDDDAPGPFASRRPEDYLPPAKPMPPQASRWLTELYTISYLIFFSFLGTLARLGVQWLTFYPGAPIITPVIWANFAGSLLMGFLSEDQQLFQDSASGPPADEKKADDSPSRPMDRNKESKAEHSKRKKTIPLYIGLATGFCGSFTSFSSFARDAFLGLANSLPAPVNHRYTGTAPTPSSAIGRQAGYSFESWAAVIITTIALSFSGLIVGGQLALLLAPITPRISVRLARRLLDPSAVILAFGCWLAAILLCIWPPDRSSPADDETWRGTALFALVFAPLGCLLRFYASLKLNGLVASFPLGTFAVNMLGTAVEGMCYDLQHSALRLAAGGIGGGRLACQVLQGVMDGFCGCLTTISTWVAEINGLRRRHGWVYAGASVLGALCLMVVIMGPVRWTMGFGDTACNTGYPNKVHG